MTRKELEERFLKIVEKDTTLDRNERNALLDQYVYAWDAADVGLIAEELNNRLNRIAGVLDYLQTMYKIQDDEDLWMLMNEIEAYAMKKGA